MLLSGLNCDVALPCATQNEIKIEGAKNLAAGGCWCLAEGRSCSRILSSFASVIIMFVGSFH